MNEDLRTRYQAILTDTFTSRDSKKLVTRIERISCKIAPINIRTGNTQTIYRWNLDTSHPHYANQEECERIFSKLCDDLIKYMGGQSDSRELIDADNGEITVDDIKAALENSSRLGSLELPISLRAFRQHRFIK